MTYRAALDLPHYEVDRWMAAGKLINYALCSEAEAWKSDIFVQYTDRLCEGINHNGQRNDNTGASSEGDSERSSLAATSKKLKPTLQRIGSHDVDNVVDEVEARSSWEIANPTNRLVRTKGEGGNCTTKPIEDMISYSSIGVLRVFRGHRWMGNDKRRSETVQVSFDWSPCD